MGYELLTEQAAGYTRENQGVPPSMNTNHTAVVASARVPFTRAGTAYKRFVAYDLARSALAGVKAASEVDSRAVEQIVFGTVMQNVQNANVARDAAIGAGFSQHTPAHTVTMACISANRAIADINMAIRSGAITAGVAGGTEMLGDIPPTFSRAVRAKFFESRGYKTPQQWLGFLSGIKAKDLLPGAPAIAEFTTGETMGESADRLAAKFGITREQQDAYALRSHTMAREAQAAGHLATDIVPFADERGNLTTQDTGIRTDSSMEKLAKLRPAFVKPFGTVTAGNASPLTDGAAAVLLMNEAHAKANGHPVLGRIVDSLFVAQDPGDELLLGPAYAVPRLLARNNLALSDIAVIEIHEAFAGQVLAVFAALESEQFMTSRDLGGAVQVDMDRVNRWGGSVSLGHPFGATGARLVSFALSRLAHEGGQYALVTACAAGGLGHAMLLERTS